MEKEEIDQFFTEDLTSNQGHPKKYYEGTEKEGWRPIENALIEQAKKKGLTGREAMNFVYGTMRKQGWKPEPGRTSRKRKVGHKIRNIVRRQIEEQKRSSE